MNTYAIYTIAEDHILYGNDDYDCSRVPEDIASVDLKVFAPDVEAMNYIKLLKQLESMEA